MGLFSKIIEWVDDSKDTLIHKMSFKRGEINQKSKLVVRESTEAIFVYNGQICDVFPCGTYDLNTNIFPILSKLAGWKYGFQTPITVDIYFVNVKQFTGYKWGTSNPIIVRDPEFGMVRVKAFGSYAFKVDDSGVFLKELFGTNSTFETKDIADWLKSMLISFLTDTIGESKISVLDLAGNTLELNQIIKANIQTKFKEIGLKLTNLYIENMSVPENVENAIDQRSKLGILGDKTDTMIRIATAEAITEAAKNPGGPGIFAGVGLGLGVGSELGSKVSESLKPQQPTQEKTSHKICPNCNAQISSTARFCPECGEKLPLQKFCVNCGARLTENAKFCPECGEKIQTKKSIE